MNKRAGAPIIILVFLLIISLAAAGGIYYLLQKEHKTAIELQDKLDDLSVKQKKAEKDLEDSRRISSDLKNKLDQAKTQMDALGTAFQQEKSARLEAATQLEQLRVDLEQQKALREDLELKFNQAQDEARVAQSKLSDLESQKQDLEAKVKELEEKTEGVELGKIVVSPEASSGKPKGSKQAGEVKEVAAAGGLEGKVLVVNKDYNFVVINLGSKDGIGIGDSFSLYHNEKYVGDVNVEKVHDSMAAAGFASADMKEKVSEGDKVAQKVK